MKKVRVTIGLMFAVIAIALATLVCVEWHKQGCGTGSLVAAIVFFTTCTAGLWATVDQIIKERQ